MKFWSGSESKNPIDEVDVEWSFAYICEGTEQIRVLTKQKKWLQ